MAQGGRKLLDPSELGTKEYWDQAYTRELDNHAEDADDEGTVWFAESNAEDAIQRCLEKLSSQGLLNRERQSSSNVADTDPTQASRFLDLGTGNGHLLFTLREEDGEDRRWAGEMIGVDYSETSVQLAKRILNQRRSVWAEEYEGEDGEDTAGAKNPFEGIRIEQWDLLHEAPDIWLGGGFDVVLDKGTFDAISLMPGSEQAQHPCDVYREKVTPLVKPGYFLLVTSCNWTKEELIEWLVVDGDGGLEYHDQAKYPTFRFGGKEGSSVVTIVFRRRQ